MEFESQSFFLFFFFEQIQGKRESCLPNWSQTYKEIYVLGFYGLEKGKKKNVFTLVIKNTLGEKLIH